MALSRRMAAPVLVFLLLLVSTGARFFLLGAKCVAVRGVGSSHTCLTLQISVRVRVHKNVCYNN